MNITKQSKISFRSVAMLASAILTLAIANTRAEDSADIGVKGKQPYVWANIETVADAEAVKPGDSIAMACAKCKTLKVTLVTQDTKNKNKLLPGENHLCPGCNSTMTVVGSKAHNKQVIKHVCKMCGDESAFCCVSKPGADATKGMEKEDEPKKP